MLFTIAIPTLPTRLDKLANVTSELYRQIAAGDYGREVEINTYIDDRRHSIGAKRTFLLQNARGEFIAFVDDDDRVSADYIERIVSAIKTKGPFDVIGMSGIWHDVKNRRRKRFVHSLEHKEYFERNGVFYRCPNHLNPIRTELIRDIPFPDSSYGEDTSWALTVCRSGVLKKEHKLSSRPLYHYDFVSDKKY